MEVFNFFFQQSPKITKILTLSCIAVSLITFFDILSPLSLYLNYKLIFKNFEIWRIFTNFFYFGEFNLSFIVHMLMFFRNSKLLEKKVFQGNAADYLYFILFCMLLLLVFSPFSTLLFLSQSLSFAMTYYWGRKSKTTIVELMGLFTVRAPYLPFFYIAIGLVLYDDFVNDLFGLIVGHIYFYIKDVLPRINSTNGVDILRTPDFFKRMCERLGLRNDFIIDVDDGDLLF